MRKKAKPRNEKDAHLRIAKFSATWREVEIYCARIIATASGVLDDPGSPMVSIRIAQGDKRTALGLLRLANPEAKADEISVPELYPSGGQDD